MICPQCKTPNDDEYIFCVNCGASISKAANPGGEPPETLIVPNAPVVVHRPDLPSQPTVLHIESPRRSKLPLILGVLAVLIAVGGVGGYLSLQYLAAQRKPSNFLPNEFGLFLRPSDSSAIAGIAYKDATNLLIARDGIATDPSLQTTEPQPEFVFYADPAEIKLSDLKFIRIDSVKDDGSLKYVDFKSSFVEERPGMKRIRFDQPLKSGKYAFALLSGFANDGNHRLWAIEVREEAQNGISFTQEISLTIKPAATPTPAASKTPEKSEPPVGSTVAFLTRKDVWLRKAAAIEDKGKIMLLKQRQKLYVIRYSSNTDTWDGISSNWALVQTENGRQGWVFNAFLDHGK